MNDKPSIWQQPDIIDWSQIIVTSYQQLLHKKLIDSENNPQEMSKNLFNAPFVVVTHGVEADPIFNYGNQAALELWCIDWHQLIQTPSRMSAERVNRATRKAMLERVAAQGYIDDYQGVRITTTGKRFSIEQAVVWNLSDRLGNKCGQAAAFSNWEWL